MSLLKQRMHVLREGVTMALDVIRTNRTRSALTNLGTAVGVFVVVVISAAIHGINASVAKDFESTGPTTFFVSRYPISFERCDGTDATCKFLSNPPLTVGDASMVGQLPTVAVAGAEIDLQEPAIYKDRRIASAQ